MKKHLFLILVALLGLVSCGDDESKTTTVSLSKSELSYTTEGGMQSIVVNGASYNNVSLPSNSDWYTFTKVASNNTQCYVRVTVTENTSYSTRNATVTLTCGGQAFSLTINQDAVPEPVTTDPMRMIEEMGLGWNLGNQMDAVNTWSYGKPVAEETAWGAPTATAATFTGLAAKGIKTVRIPVTWVGHMGEAPDYKIDETWMNRVAELVGFAKAAGLYAIINLHHDEGAGEGHYGFLDIKAAAYDTTKNNSVKAQLKAVWTQIAAKFKNESDYLIFETMNEVQDGNWGWGKNKTDGGKQYATLNEWQQVAVDAIRTVGGQNTNRWIAVVGYAQDPSLTVDNLVLPSDPTPNRMMVAVHCYDPYDYTLASKYNEWGHTSTESVTKNGEASVVAILDNLKAKYIDNNIPVYIGEMGCVNRATDRARLFQKYYMEYFAKACRDRYIPCCIWDNGAQGSGEECSYFINHGTGEWFDYGADVVTPMVKAMNSTDEAYTLQSIYNNAPR